MGIELGRMHSTVSLIGSLIAKGRPEALVPSDDEAELIEELVACVLSAQVTAESARRALDCLQDRGLLLVDRWRDDDLHFEWQVAHALRSASYRFPRVKARTLTELRSELRRMPIRERLEESGNAEALRARLTDLPGLGPKHASMFLRNIGRTFDLAILDVHVLRYLACMGLVREFVQVQRLPQYLKLEAVARRYAEQLGHPVGVLDWAIWVTMRALREVEQ